MRGTAAAAAFVLRCEARDVSAPLPDDHVRGPATERVTVVEYGDYQMAQEIPCLSSFRIKGEVGIDRVAFAEALHPRRFERGIAESHQRALETGVCGVPTFLRNGRQLRPLPLSREALEQPINVLSGEATRERKTSLGRTLAGTLYGGM